MFSKDEARAEYKRRRKEVAGREEKETGITANVFREFGYCRTVFCYESFGSEVSTKAIIKGFLERGANVYVPLVNGEEMLVKDIVSGQLADKPCELTIVPLLAFDKECSRLGYGRGYYDRYLAANKTLAVGIAFAEQYCEDLPKNEHDVPLSCIIMPDIVYDSPKNEHLLLRK